jgi:thiol-disulfide isomerase/thioredoxin
MKKYFTFILIIPLFMLLLISACDKVQPPYKNEIPTDTIIKIKRVICEEGTGTWCTYCTRGICALEKMKSAYPDNFIPIAIHNDDIMTVADYDAAFSPYSPSYPFSIIDRTLPINGANYNEILSTYLTAVNTSPPVDMSITNLSWNSSTRVLSYTVSAEVIKDFDGDYRFNSVLTEDSVHGTSTAWDQANFYGGTGNEMCGFESLSNVVPAANMYYMHVARHIFDGWDGIQGSIPDTNNIGATLTKTYTYTLPVGWNATHINAIGFIINKTDGTIVNACQKENIGK